MSKTNGQAPANNSGYDIRDRLSVLTKSKASKTKYLCPVCGGDDLDINPRTGAYNCFSGGCDSKDIRAAIDRLEGKPEWKPEQDNWVKPVRPKSEQEYFYPERASAPQGGRDGKPLVKVVRIDPGDGSKKRFPQYHWDGSKWVIGNPDEVKKLIPIYRRAEVREAIGRGELVFILEGEAAVDAAWELGIPATTTIGGAGKFSAYGDYTEDLDGGQFALAPDRDAVGVKHMGEIAKFLGDRVKGYYLAGTQGLWRNPQGGMDIGDDIRDHQLTKEQILAKVISPQEYAKIVNPPSATVPNVPTSGDTKPSNDRQITATVIKSRVEAIVSRNLPTVDLQSELVALSRQLGVSKSSLEGIAQELERSITASADKVEIDKILTAQRHQLSPHQILPESIADKIEQISKARGVNPEPLILGQLVAVSSVPHANTRLFVNNHGDVLSVYPNLFGMAVGDSGSLKSPTIGTGFTKPLRALQTTYIDKYESALIEYKSLYKAWESQDKKERGDEPEPPRLVVVVAEDATMEKIEDLALYQAGICPGIYRDEIIGIFQAFDKHGGKGNDSRSKLLSYYDGSPINIHRVGAGSKISKHDYHPVVFGGIQPEVLKGLAQLIGMDSDGTLCRFLYAPITRTYKAWDEEPDTERIDTNAFSQLIEKVHRLPALECHLDHEGQKTWAKFANYYNHECLTNPQLSQWLKHAYSKAIGQLGKLALTLHLIECATTNKLSAIISAETIERAAMALDYFISQAISLVANTEESLESHLVKILAKSKELGSIRPREVSRIFSSKQRPNTVLARSYLEQLASGGYGVFSEGIFTPSSVVPADVTKCPRMSPTLGHQETSDSNGFNNNVTNVTNLYQPQIPKGVSYESDDNDHPTPARIYPSPELVTLVTRVPEATAPSGLEGVPELVTNPGTLVTSPGTPAGTPSLTVGTLVKHSDPFNVRGNDTGVVENATQSGYQIYWKSDGDTQIAIAFRTYDREELEVVAA